MAGDRQLAGEGGVKVPILRRRARTPLPLPRVAPVVPATVFVRPDVLCSIRLACDAAGDYETGGPLIGTIQRSWERVGERLIVAVLGMLPPGPGMRARSASVALGALSDGERAASALRWWRSVTGLDLVHLGDWHLHPSGYPEPSGGDVRTAGRMRRESDAAVWLTAVAADAGRRHESLETKGHLVRLTSEGDSSLDIGFYREAGLVQLLPTPTRVESTAVPRLPALPWHLADPMRFAVECRLLDAAGFKTAISKDGARDLQLRISRNGSAVTVTTGSGYPEEKPRLVDHRPGAAGGWSPDRFLVDLVQEVCR